MKKIRFLLMIVLCFINIRMNKYPQLAFALFKIIFACGHCGNTREVILVSIKLSILDIFPS